MRIIIKHNQSEVFVGDGCFSDKPNVCARVELEVLTDDAYVSIYLNKEESECIVYALTQFINKLPNI